MNEATIVKRSIDVRLGVQKALLDSITANIRAIFCEWNDEAIKLRIIFDKKIRSNDETETEIVKARLLSFFPKNKVAVELLRVDYPIPRPNFNDSRLLYQRKETSSGVSNE